MRSSFFPSRLAIRAVCTVLSVMWLLYGVAVGGYAQTQPDIVWQPTKGVAGGNVTDLVNAGSTLYASTDIGIFRSNNEGDSWALLPNALINRPVRLATKGTDVYAYTPVSTVNFSPFLRFSSNQSESGILRSRDSGMTWQPVGTGVLSGITQILTTNNAIFAVKSTRLPLNNGVANATQIIFRSTDDGATWQQILSLNNIVINWTPNGSTVYAFTATQTIAANGQTLVAVAQGQGIMRSEDNGTTWQNVNSMPVSSYYTSVVQANNQFFVTEKSSSSTSTQGVRIFRSSDGGRTWFLAQSSPQLLYAQFSRMISIGSVLFAIAPNIIDIASNISNYYRHENVLRSTDNGVSWNTVTLNSEFSAFVRCITAIGQKVFFGTDVMGILRPSNIGMAWERANTGLLNTYHKRGTANTLGAFNMRGKTLYAQTVHGVWRTDDKGETWIEIVTSEGREGLFGSFAALGQGVTTSHVQTDSVKFTVAPGPVFRYNALKRSLDGGKTWRTVVDAGQLVDALNLAVNANIEVFTVQNPQTLYIGVREIINGSSSGGSGVPPLFASAFSGGSSTPSSSRFESYRSTDGGAMWVKMQKINDSGIDILHATESELYAIVNSNRRIYRSTDKGSTWKSITSQPVFNSNVRYNGGLPFANDFIINNNVFYIASNEGVYYSTDKGGTFHPMNIGLPIRSGLPMRVTGLAVLGNTMFAATENSVYRAELPPTLSISLDAPSALLPLPITNPQFLALDTTMQGIPGTPRPYLLSGQNLTTSTIIITAPTGVEIATTSNGQFSTTLELPATNGSLSATSIFVRLNSANARTVSGDAITHRAGATSASVLISGVVQLLSMQLTATPQLIRLDTILRFSPSLQRTYTVTGANLIAPITITAPDGILLFNMATSTWVQSLMLATSATGSVMQTIVVRLDSSVVRTISNAEILHTSSLLQASVRVSGVVQQLPMQLTATPQEISLGTIIHFDPSPQKTYTVTGANLVAPVTITAPEGVLLFSATTNTWTRTLTLPTSATGSVMQTVAVRLDSSQLRSIVNQEITNVSAGVQATVRVSGAVVPLFLPDGAETTLELRLMPLRSPFLIRDTARVQVWLKDSRLLAPRLVGRFAKKLHVTLRLDTNNFNIVGVATPASTRASFDTIASPRRLPRTSPFTTLLIERIDTTTTRELLLAELLLQAAVGATTTNTLRAAQPTTWLGNTATNTARITWGVDSLRLEIRPLFAPRRQAALVAIAAPNPSNGEVELHYTLSPATQETAPLTLVVSDMAGRVLQRVELGERKVGEAQRETVHLRGLAAGAYRLMLVSPVETLFGRIDIVK